MRRLTYVFVVLFSVCSVIGAGAGQGTQPISVGLGAGLPLPIGQTSIVTVTVKNIVNSTVQLIFVGLRFEWDKPDRFFVGANSDKGAVLAAGEQIKYPILVKIPDNATQGTHKLDTYITYRWFKDGNWTGKLSGFWVSDIPIAYPRGLSQQSQVTTGVGSQQTSNLETISVLVAVVVIGLFLERDRVKRFIGKFRETPSEQPTPVKPNGEKPSVEEKEEEL